MKKIFIAILMVIATKESIAQQLPSGECGIVYVHDAAGNRMYRVYFCNNGSNPYPGRNASQNNFAKTAPVSYFSKKEMENLSVQQIDALYPNPTSGMFTLAFSRPLQNAAISIMDANGKTIQQFTASGLAITCNISTVASGSYFVRIEDNHKLIIQKVIKK